MSIRLFRPPQLIWLLAHVIVFLIGITLIATAPEDGSTWSGTAIGIGASLVASGVAGYVLYVYVFITTEAEAKLNIVWDTGIRNVFGGRSVAIRKEYHNRIRESREIDIIGFGLSSFRQDYQNEFKAFGAAKIVRILLLHPEFPNKGFSLADLRDNEEGNALGRIKDDINQFIEQTAEVRSAYPSTFQVRMMTALPSINYFRVDDELFWGPYLAGMQSRNMPTLLVSRGGFLFNRLQEHFEKLWTDPNLSTEIVDTPRV